MIKNLKTNSQISSIVVFFRQDPTDFSVLEDDMDGDEDAILETHSQNNILNSSSKYFSHPLN